MSGLVVRDVRAPPDVVWDRLLDFAGYGDMDVGVPPLRGTVVGCQTYEDGQDDDRKKKASTKKKTKKKKGGKNEEPERTITSVFRIGLGLPLFPDTTLHAKHSHYPAHNSLTWTLGRPGPEGNHPSDDDSDDDSSSSNVDVVDDAVGRWYVVPLDSDEIPEDEEEGQREGDLADWSRVYYQIKAAMPSSGPVPLPLPRAVRMFLGTRALADATGWVKTYSEEQWRADPRNLNLGGAAVEEEEEKEEVLVVGNDDAATAANTTTVHHHCAAKPSRVLTVRAALVRIALLMTVSSLLVYNISLCLSLDRY